MTVEELKAAAEKAIADGEFEKAAELINQIKNFEETDVSDKPSDEVKSKEDEEVPEGDNEEIEKDEEPKKDEEKGEQRKMPKTVLEHNENKNEEVRSFATFVKTKGEEKRDGLTTVGAEAVIPIERLTTPQTQPETVVDLRTFAEKVPVTTGSGSYPVLLKNKGVMISVEELEKNPALAKPEFKKVSWAVKTYRGYIPISQEALEDSDIDLAGLVANHVQRQALNTANAEISKVLKTATAKELTSLDDLKDLVNVTIEPAYPVSFVASQSFFNAVDKLKDKDGRYLLQQDVTTASGYKLLGREIIVLGDDVIGSAAGDQVAFIGDIKAFTKFFDRKQESVRWVDDNIYGQLLAAFIRFDVEAADTDAGFYATLALSDDEGK
ncbi:phage major capsid protein [Brochothrix campestris]|uniref:Capsid protein n=1 Tax=Brochothrix campestris FSL F6-1037 TaxID=1265861 RepID=W7CMB8_9LIST|nr:phage major capsid protein [Brochothrix campestris]EUJ34268.1 capsid protein [Brochothrix campestris FSL F6-1037]